MEVTVRQHSKISFQSVDARKLKSFTIDYEDVVCISIADTNLEQQKMLQFQLSVEGAMNNVCSNFCWNDFFMEKEDAYEFVALVRGYAFLLTKRRLNYEALVHRNVDETKENNALPTAVSNEVEEKDISLGEREDQSIAGPAKKEILENSKHIHDEAENLLEEAPIFNLTIHPKKLLMAKDSIRIHNRYLAKSTPLLNEARKKSCLFNN
ncbi:hypothetical protein D918_08577 [Trichuris suis]|nr:hypothetical protein D918_08577 [Trichuris suis]